MNEPITIVIPGPPKGKGRPRFRAATGRAYTPKDTRAYEKSVAMLAKAEMRSRPPMNEPVELFLRAVFEIPKSWSKRKADEAILGRIRPTSSHDIDNIVKGVADGLNGIAYRDDGLIVSITASKWYGASPFVVATVKPIEGARTPSQIIKQEASHV